MRYILPGKRQLNIYIYLKVHLKVPTNCGEAEAENEITTKSTVYLGSNGEPKVRNYITWLTPF